MLLVGWGLMPQPGQWTLRVLAVIALVPLSTHLAAWMRLPFQHWRSQETTNAAAPISSQVRDLLLQTAQTLACLPYETAYSLGAITRTLWRVLWSKRRLLEWRPILASDPASHRETPRAPVRDERADSSSSRSIQIHCGSFRSSARSGPGSGRSGKAIPTDATDRRAQRRWR